MNDKESLTQDKNQIDASFSLLKEALEFTALLKISGMNISLMEKY